MTWGESGLVKKDFQYSRGKPGVKGKFLVMLHYVDTLEDELSFLLAPFNIEIKVINLLCSEKSVSFSGTLRPGTEFCINRNWNTGLLVRGIPLLSSMYLSCLYCKYYSVIL